MVIGPVPAPAMPLPGRSPDVLIAVVTFNSEAVVEPFLRALPAALEGAGTAAVVVVDNASSDATTNSIRALAPWATVIESEANHGYAAGINAALAHTRAGRGVYVLNPDAIPSRGSVALLADAVEKRPGIGIAVPRIVDEHGHLMFSLRYEPTIIRALGEAVLGGNRASRHSWASEVIRETKRYVDGAGADWATGAAMFISTQTVDIVGRWNEQFFLYSEETDYALRARDAGLLLTFVSRAEVSHRGGDLTTTPWLWSLAAVNRVRLYRARHGVLRGNVYRLAVLLNEMLRCSARSATHRAAALALLRGVQIPPGALVTPSSDLSLGTPAPEHLTGASLRNDGTASSGRAAQLAPNRHTTGRRSSP